MPAGGVFEHYKAYRGYLTTALAQLMGAPNAALIKMKQFRDSSSMGAAYLAAAIMHDGEAVIS